MKSERSSGASLRTALILNAVFLVATAIIIRVGFESNDDLGLAAYVDGQMSHSTIYVPYLNIVLGWLMRTIYNVLGRDTAWHTFCQYLLLYVAFSTMSYVWCERLGTLRGALVTLLVLLFFGVDVYCIINYTKTAALCTVAGMMLLVHRSEDAYAGRAPSLVLGIVLCLLGFMLRDMEFLPCFVLMTALCLRRVWELLFEEKAGAAETWKKLLRFAAPFAAVLVLAAGLYAVNEAAWSREPWSFYHKFDAVRVAYSDYGRPAYESMPDAYEALGLSKADVGLLDRSNYFDPDVFSADTMRAITEARDAHFPRPSLGVCLGLLLDRCIPHFFVNLHVYGFLFMLALWLAAGGRRLKDWVSLGAAVCLFTAAYLYLIWRGRYLIDRVDLGLFLAVVSVMACSLERPKLERERAMSVFLLIFAILVSHYLMRESYRVNDTEDFSAERAAVERLLEDEEHLYFAKLDTVSDRIYSPFEPAGQGYWDRIVLLGGYDVNHPSIMEILARSGVRNPYRDCVANPRVRFIEDNIELTLQFIHEHYDPAAYAELVEPLSTETGLAIYEILH